MRRNAWLAVALVSALVAALGGPTHAGTPDDPCTLPSGFCLHSDVYDGRAQAPWTARATAPPTAPPVCYGDGQTGPRVQLIYGYVAGQRSRAASVVPRIRSVIAPRMEAVVRAASAGHDLGIRFAFESGCGRLSVPVVAFPAGTVAAKEAHGQFPRMITHLQGLGFDRTDRKYQVVWDWWTADAVCGLGELSPQADQPMPANAHNGVPTVGARTDAASTLGVQVGTPRYSAVWRNAFSARGPQCWELDQSGAGVEVHELMHTLGAVALTAPHSDGGGHCTDTPSVMCTGRPGRPTVRACAAQRVQVLDCGKDDFWNPDPAQGSYLAGAGNVAASQFFGPQPQDDLRASPI